MKPIKIVMSAFGSYAGVEIIEFTASDHGLFLITGDTGSGKTTIFDAITYALYDQTSGGRRDGSMMRSQYASADTETYVEYTFSYEDRLYKVRRSPEYLRQGRRKAADGSFKLVKELSKVELLLPDGSAYVGRKKETDKMIEEIIGLDKEQFTQIVMIAQGDFLKLLHAESKERKKIFSRIFQTRFYYKMEEELRERAKRLYICLEDNRKDIDREVSRVECGQESSYIRPWEEDVRAGRSDYAETESLLECIVKEEAAKEKELSLEIRGKRKRLDEVSRIISGGEAANRLFEALSKAMERKEQLDSQEEHYKVLKENIRIGRRAEKVLSVEEHYRRAEANGERIGQRLSEMQEKLHAETKGLQRKKEELESAKLLKTKEEAGLLDEMSRLKRILPKYKELHEMKEILQKMTENAKEKIKESKEAQKNVKGLEKEEKEINKFREKNSDCMLRLQKLQSDIDKRSEEIKKFLELQSRMENSGILLKDADIIREKLKAQTDICTSNARKFEKLYDDFLRGQAGILARELEEGNPCPVCGATCHPRKADTSEKTPDEKAVKDAREERDCSEAVREEILTAYQKKSTQLELEEAFIRKEYKMLMHRNPGEDSMEKLGTRLAKLSEENERASASYQKMEVIAGMLEENTRKLAAIQAAKLKALTLYEQSDMERLAAEDKKKHVEIEYQILTDELPYKDEKTAARQFEKTERSLAKLQNGYESAQAAYEKSAGIIKELEGQCRATVSQAEANDKEAGRLKARYHSEMKKQKFESAEEYREGALLAASIADSEKEAEDYRRRNDEIKGTIRTLREQTKGKKPADISGFREEQMELQKDVKDSQQIQIHLASVCHKNKEALDDIRKYMDTRNRLEKEYTCINNLSRTANGSLSGSIKIDFETYVQRRYFKQIIYAANVRLGRMTNQEFILQCREMENLGSQGQVGLDLDVYHLVNDTVRDVRTLSGGESFMAALSMALGLSDMIQNQAGAVHLDTMFVDEGFGSLDDEARERAIQVLGELAGEKRLVGIISHVNELKEQIDHKLLVTKDAKGSHAGWVV